MNSIIRNALIFTGVVGLFGTIQYPVRITYILSNGVSAVELSGILVASYVGQLLFDVLFSYLFDARSRRLSMALGSLTFAVHAGIMIFAQSSFAFMVAAFSYGVAMAFIFGSLVSIVVERLDDKQHLKKILLGVSIIYQLSAIIGWTAGIVIALLLGFKLVFMIQVVLSLICASLAFVLLPPNKIVSRFSLAKLKWDVVTIGGIYFTKANLFFTISLLGSLMVTAAILGFWPYFLFDQNQQTNSDHNIILIGGVYVGQCVLGIVSSLMLRTMPKSSPITWALGLVVISVILLLAYIIYPVTNMLIAPILLVFIATFFMNFTIKLAYQNILPDSLRSTAVSMVGTSDLVLSSMFVPALGVLIYQYHIIPFIGLYALYGVVLAANIIILTRRRHDFIPV